MGEVAISLDLRMSWLWEAQPADMASVETKRFFGGRAVLCGASNDRTGRPGRSRVKLMRRQFRQPVG